MGLGVVRIRDFYGRILPCDLDLFNFSKSVKDSFSSHLVSEFIVEAISVLSCIVEITKLLNLCSFLSQPR